MATMMAERMERERILALYGDSSPRPRTGRSSLNSAIATWCAKEQPSRNSYTKRKTGMGSIPVPEVICSDWDRIAMEYMDQLRGYISQMRAIPGNFIGRLDHQGVIIASFVMRSGGPFARMACSTAASVGLRVDVVAPDYDQAW
ncbi:hypothetical protein J3459_007339 [Metarhizium acridum]|uniref:uncharacterized protein n=1 Tax=Metarhizium acridum TaxID=92637 RepID=UPI001C6B641C|nr:hypothetical protein J3458_006923 [Metarhizium acridum]KAG8427306.1 hypothetical protein J3459_007339 [Metarhizium acridum]